jgi:hypothetical protein
MRRQWTPDDGNAGGYAARGRLRDMRQLTACCGLLVMARWPPGIVAAAAERKRAATDVCFKRQLRGWREGVAFGVSSSGGRCCVAGTGELREKGDGFE